MIAAALTFSCQKAELEDNGVVDNGKNEVVDFVPGPGKILAVTPSGEAETKVAFGTANNDGSIPVVWVNGDAIKVYSENNTTGAEYTFEGTDASSAVFTGEPVEGETRYAVYPLARAKEMKDGKIGVSFADLQQKQLFHSTLKNNSNNLKYMPMWAKETEAGCGEFVFQNLCGAVAFRFNDYQELRGMKITNVTLTSKTMNISGWGYVDPATGELTLHGSDESDRYISVNNDKSTGPYDIANTSNKSISDAGKTGFIMALPAGTYPAGDLTVTITDNFGRVFEQVVSSELVIRPGEMRTFPTLSFTFCYGKSNCIVVKKGETISFDAAPYYSFSKNLSVDSMKPVMTVKVENGEDVGEGEEAVEAVDAGDATGASLEEALYFARNSGIDALAPAIGTAHGFYKGEPKLHFDLLKELAEKVPVPLALHGGSGTGDENISKACRMGISKVNVANELMRACYDALQADGMEGNNIYKFWPVLEKGYKAKCAHLFEVCGCAGKA